MQASFVPDGVNAAVNAASATAGSAGNVSVRWRAQGARMALIRDRRTGQVLSFARGSGARVRAPSDDIEIILSDGVRSASRQLRASNR
jgi:hypothetical protein